MVRTHTRSLGIWIFVLAGLPLGSTSGAEVSAGLKLVVAQSLDQVEVMVAARVTRIRPEWGPPVLAGPEVPAGLSELLVVFHDPGGRPLGVYGFPGVGADAFDVLIPGGADDGEALTGRVSFPAVTDRILELPLPSGSAYLVLALARVGEPRSARPSPTRSPDRSCVDLGATPEGTLALELTAFSVYSLNQEFGGPASISGQRGALLSPPFPAFPPLQIRPGCQPVQLRSNLPKCPYPNGATYVDRVPLLAAAGAGDRFDVVILGDGFESAEFPKLQNFATQIAASLPAAAPFNQFPGKIKIDLVRTISPQSGITNCSTGGNRTTYYGVEGKWPDDYGIGGPGYLGTRWLCRILSAVDTVLPWPDADLIVMIANCDLYGGRAQFGDHLIYLTTWLNPNAPDPPYGSFKRVALHETGHVVAWLGEEYVACAKPNPAYPFPKYFPNVALRRSQPPQPPQPPMLPAGGGGAVIEGPAIWWRDLLNPNERLPSGDFAAIHRCGDSWVNPGPPPCGPVVPAPGNAGMLGLFWGAMYGSATGSPNQCEVRCEDPNNPNGPVVGTASCDYYRPEANCRMRTLSAPWCRACMAKMTEALRAATGP